MMRVGGLEVPPALRGDIVAHAGPLTHAALSQLNPRWQPTATC
jgi:hypothetical protein